MFFLHDGANAMNILALFFILKKINGSPWLYFAVSTPESLKV
jgi:hypothetical protein